MWNRRVCGIGGSVAVTGNQIVRFVYTSVYLFIKHGRCLSAVVLSHSF